MCDSEKVQNTLNLFLNMHNRVSIDTTYYMHQLTPQGMACMMCPHNARTQTAKDKPGSKRKQRDHEPGTWERLGTGSVQRGGVLPPPDPVLQ